MSDHYILTLSCRDHPGIVAAVATCLAFNGANILDAQQFDDILTGQFFMRVEFVVSSTTSIAAIRSDFDDIAPKHGFAFTLRGTVERKRVFLLASRYDHCLAELMYRWKVGELGMDVVGIASNHPRETYAHLDFAGVPFHYLPVTKGAKHAQEAELKRIIGALGVDLVVLARYMQILSNDMAAFLSGRCINIHHSLLPGFKGAKPYHQAHARGVKLIGATAHFVTPDLDEGPIIEQDVERISHRDTPDDMVRKGRETERRVLARAVRMVLEDRVLMNGHSTVVFSS